MLKFPRHKFGIGAEGRARSEWIALFKTHLIRYCMRFSAHLRDLHPQLFTLGQQPIQYIPPPQPSTPFLPHCKFLIIKNNNFDTFSFSLPTSRCPAALLTTHLDVRKNIWKCQDDQDPLSFIQHHGVGHQIITISHGK